MPDFERTAKLLLNKYTPFKSRAVAERHLFGSHEAFWAVHYEGYSPQTIEYFIKSFGYKEIKIKKNQWKNTYNLEIFAEKSCENITKAEFGLITEKYLNNFLVDNTESENKLLQVWMEIYNKQIEVGWANND